MITDSQLQQIMPTLSSAKRQMYLPFLNAIMPTFSINTPLREAAFLAQIAHESGELKFWEEIWGPTAQQKKYEPPSDLARRLGNTQPGDGKRYKGRGPIQITGRANYRRYGGLLGVDLEGNPDLASTTQIGLQVSCQFWKTNGLNELADVSDFVTITKRINGGLNGLDSRQKYYERAKRALGISSSFGGFTASAVKTRSVAPQDNGSVTNALPRGQEAIEEVIGTSAASGSRGAASKKKLAVKSVKKTSAVKVVRKAARKSAKPVASKKSAKSAAKTASKKAGKTQTKNSAKKVAKAPSKKTAKKTAKKK